MAASKLFKQLKAKPPRDLDAVVHGLHEEAKHLGMKTAAFEAQYLRVDEDKDWVLQQLPCPFLGTDNYCSIYDVRPKACREYPHTDRVKQHQILHLTEKNAAICPAVDHIVQRMEALYLKAQPSSASEQQSRGRHKRR